jgi:hypothetical protein
MFKTTQIETSFTVIRSGRVSKRKTKKVQLQKQTTGRVSGMKYFFE